MRKSGIRAPSVCSTLQRRCTDTGDVKAGNIGGLGKLGNMGKMPRKIWIFSEISVYPKTVEIQFSDRL